MTGAASPSVFALRPVTESRTVRIFPNDDASRGHQQPTQGRHYADPESSPPRAITRRNPCLNWLPTFAPRQRLLWTA